MKDQGPGFGDPRTGHGQTRLITVLCRALDHVQCGVFRPVNVIQKGVRGNLYGAGQIVAGQVTQHRLADLLQPDQMLRCRVYPFCFRNKKRHLRLMIALTTFWHGIFVVGAESGLNFLF